MSGERLTLDGNVLVYAVDREAGERHERAATLGDEAADHDCVLTLQALSEFHSAVTRKGKMPAGEAAAQIEDWHLLFPTAEAKPTTLRQAIAASRGHSLPFWDVILRATAKEAGVTVILTEDFRESCELSGVRFRNPFAVPPRVR